MKLKEFFRPQSVEEAVRRMKAGPGRGAYVAGGTELLMLLERGLALDFVVDLTALDLNYIRREGDKLRIGATTTIDELERSEQIKNMAEGLLYQCARQFSSPQLRNMATIGGNIAGAVPSADSPPPLIALGAQARIIGEGGEVRDLPLEDIFTGVREIALDGDMLQELLVPLPPPGLHCRFLKTASTPGGIAIVNLATALKVEEGICQEVRIALGAVAPTPMRAREAEEFLRGKELNEKSITKAAEIVAQEVRPIGDQRASADYRRQLSFVLTERALLDSVGKETGDGAPH